MNSTAEKTASLVPEFYFDLIARVISGLLSYICFDYAWWGIVHIPKAPLDALTLVCGCYALGLIVDLTGDLILDKFKYFDAVRNVLDELLKIENPQANILVKMCAEVVLLRSLTLISLGLFVFSMTANIFKVLPQHLNSLTPLISISFILFFMLFSHSQRRIMRRLEILKPAESISEVPAHSLTPSIGSEESAIVFSARRDGSVISTHTDEQLAPSQTRLESGFGCARGLIIISPNFDAPLEEFSEYI